MFDFDTNKEPPRMSERDPSLFFLNGDLTMLMNDLFERYEWEAYPELTPRVARDYGCMMVYISRAFGHMDHTDVKPRHVAAFLDVKNGKVHRNRMVMILSSVFEWARAKWCIDDNMTNPCRGVRRHKTHPRRRYVTDDEVNAFCATVTPIIDLAVRLAISTGQRQGDLLNLKWSDVRTPGDDREKWGVYFCQGKTGRELEVGINERLEALLDRAYQMKPDIPKEYVLRTKWGKPFTSDGFRAKWQRAMNRYVAAGQPRFVFHDLRAKSVSDAPTLEEAYARAGHTDIGITRGIYKRNVQRVNAL